MAHFYFTKPHSFTTTGSHTKYMLMILFVETSEKLNWFFDWLGSGCFLHKNKEAGVKRALTDLGCSTGTALVVELSSASISSSCLR